VRRFLSVRAGVVNLIAFSLPLPVSNRKKSCGSKTANFTKTDFQLDKNVGQTPAHRKKRTKKGTVREALPRRRAFEITAYGN